ncbi:hypothetical protein pEaSNUABM14_00040 [Erwinia phage pEa_SNUABM_14]|uniref:Uncharacterized protein n=1 Tax=Erwinia phage pEa_SNUABM_7 TaxID=2866695 RepID=A0AAE8BP13_9CAUD|nr:hypothetical protein MPK74_gp040 [Erwinia phage pEa_SNUABM_7]QYW03000.1 hypothetical protein pEaSNUABM13_00041 [Erwinia phage pEa_SNUABM_13]QYW03342.1 hypothetical protein pEaSNUABM34_00040 [Erwinia phage pEa_SNUABM_34]QYW03683.1 hypothetical protein pEaSNUABM45_00040 [Erwinia phage pEa_SNUABM_45]QYW04024.1 hypothetical protein pEaSNUABM46_00040 [Erwinia phage pEa_SNUABM_46]QYW04365.1 hypothetical protein pEaSNUABM14_00040 [Erwinia phage pEa_SNUABM_14]QYW05055.1 hypothetical protein pEaSNU
MSQNELDDFDIPDLDEAEQRAEAKRDGGGEVVEASDECEGGACKI